MSVRIHVAPVFAPARIQENIFGELFMYWFRARGYCTLFLLYLVLLIEIQEESITLLVGRGRGLRGTKIVNEHFVNKLAFPSDAKPHTTHIEF